MIVFCHLLNDRSGSPTVLLASLQVLTEHSKGLLFVGSQGRGVLDEANVPIRRYWYRRSRHRIVTLFTFIVSQFALYRSLSKATDIPSDATIFVNTLLPFGAMLWGRRTGRKVVVHVHEVSITPSPLRWLLTNCARHCADQLFYVSEDHRRRLPIDGPQSRILPNPVSPALTARAGKYVPRRSGTFNVLMLASLRGYKGVNEFMALANSLSHRKDVTFTLVLNAEPTEVQAFERNYQTSANVTLHPRTDDPAYFYERADLLLNLSRVDQWIETFGLTIAEAMTFGLPVIVPPVGGPAEIVADKKEGYCIDSRNAAELSDAVVSLVDSDETHAAMSKAAFARSQIYTFDAYSNALRAAMPYVAEEVVS